MLTDAPLRLLLPTVVWAIPVISVIWLRYQRVPRVHTFSLVVIAVGMSIIVGGLFLQSFVRTAGGDTIQWLIAMLSVIGTVLIIILRVEGSCDSPDVM